MDIKDDKKEGSTIVTALRFVHRNGMRILQQKVNTYLPAGRYKKGDWEDIPLENEDETK